MLSHDYLISPFGLDQRTLGNDVITTKYSRTVGEVRQYLVSSSGQMSLPAAARHRWDLDDGGPVDVIDLGFAVLTLPRGEGRRILNDLVSRDDHAAFVRSLDDDPELATQRDPLTGPLLLG